MWVFANRFPKDHLLIAPRGIFQAPAGGYAWHSNPNRANPKVDDFRTAVDRLSDLINNAVIPSGDFSRLNMTGFSEGAALVYTFALLHPQNIHAIAGLSGFLPEDIGSLIGNKPLSGKNVFITHGTRDHLVPVSKARRAAELLEAAGAHVTYCEDDVGHKLSASCFRGLEGFYAHQFSENQR
jgi:phospholipase/carboxylesterase